MTGPSPAVAATRVGVKAALDDLEPGARVLVACSGGADSLALAAAAAFVARKAGWLVGVAVIDHGLQAGSAEVAERAAEQCRELGCDPVEVIAVDVGETTHEAAARTARYRALDEVAHRQDAVVLLGHTADDQAEQVLLGLARGSGARSLAGRPARRGRYRRPFLTVTREQTETACAESGLMAWQDPANADPSYLRSRVRTRVLPFLEAELGPGVAAALVRSADQLRADADLLDQLAREHLAPLEGCPSIPVDQVAMLPTALRRRVLREWLVSRGVPAGQLWLRHIVAVDSLLLDWHGQRGISLPGGRTVRRSAGRLHLGAPDMAG